MTDRPITYLLVEDDQKQADTLSKWLKKVAANGGHTINVVIANGLTEGLEKSRSCKPDATFLDLHLNDTPDEPEKPGWQRVADSIPFFGCRAVIVIAVTGEPDPDHEIELYCYAKGCANFFSKPYDASFFERALQLFSEKKIFAADLIKAAGSAQLRAQLGPQNGTT